MTQYAEIFSDDALAAIFPADRADAFFDALFGDVDEGSYDITLCYGGNNGDRLSFELRLDQRPGKCLACNLTYGLPQVFTRHPIINLQGVADAVAKAAGRDSATWQLGATREVTNAQHVIPFAITLS